jgi:hypothetical protein
MKKVIFAVLAAFAMSLGMISCSSSPQDKLVSLAEEMVSTLKDAHIKSADDAKTLKEKIDKISKEGEEISAAMEKEMEGLSDTEKLKKLGEMTEFLEKASKLKDEAEAEVKRLKKEAEENNVDLSDLDLDIL